MPILNSAYHAVKYAKLRIGILLKICRFVIRHITQTDTETETEANFTHVSWKRTLGIASLTEQQKIYEKTDENESCFKIPMNCFFEY